MVLVLGTNCGFVTVAPTTDPEGTADGIADGTSLAIKDTTPAYTSKVLELGWYCHGVSEAGNFEMAIYTHNSGDNNPEAVVTSISTLTAKGTDAGWKTVDVSGLNIVLDGSTVYWIGVALTNTATNTIIHRGAAVGSKFDYKTGIVTLSDPWGASSGAAADQVLSIYAKIQQVPLPHVSDLWINE